MKNNGQVIIDHCGERMIRTTINDDGSATVAEYVGGQAVRTTIIEDYSAFQRAEHERAEQLRREHERQAREHSEQQEREDERAEEEFRRAIYCGVMPPITTEVVQDKCSDDPDRPRWDGDRFTLYYGEHAVRKVRPIAVGMCQLLQTFQDDGWPPRIDNPLTPDVDLSRQLRDLNSKIDGPLRFRRDGSGEGVLWEVATDGDG